MVPFIFESGGGGGCLEWTGGDYDINTVLDTPLLALLK